MSQSSYPIEPIAIIGMGCRFPGAANPEQFWQLLRSGADIIKEIPAERWDVDAYYDPDPNAAGKMYARKAYFLEDVDKFDPQFFNLTPREVAAMDPQQRLVLEVSWEALENANLPPSTLAGSRTGLFVSSFWDDYSAQRLYGTDPTRIDHYAVLSNQRAMIVGRPAHFFGVHGPNVLIDTACSSSLTALHLACQSLRADECDLALVGGVYLLLTPEVRIGLSRMRAISADGRSKAFDRAADGFGMGEGCGMVLLKRLTDAQADGDTILALLRGSAINHDGRSLTVTIPNVQAQQMVLRAALTNAGVTPEQVQYLETHGTGTPMGDPIEVAAIGKVFGATRQTPLAIGSVKTNIGHLNSAAGMASLLKVVLAMQHGEIPPTLHINQLNPNIPWQKLAVTVPTTVTPWPANGAPRLAGISAFGLSGSNAHLIVEEAPFPLPQPAKAVKMRCDRTHHLLPISATTLDALRAQAERYSDYLRQHPTISLADVCHTAATGRQHFAHRLALVVTSTNEAAQQLSTLVQTANESGSNKRPPKVAFLFTGQGSQYVGMGQALYQTQPTFRDVLDRCDVILQECLGRSLLELIYPPTLPTHNDLMESHPCGQAANFALECALADLWRSWGVQPNLVLGHSLGDFAAAYCAGVLTLEDGLRLVVERGRLMEAALGSMVSVLAAEEEVATFLAPFADVTIGVINGPASVVISGSHAQVAQATAALQQAGFKTRKLEIPVAAHSPMLDPVLDRFEAAVRKVKLAHATCTVVSSMTGQIVKHELTDPLYWRKHLRNTVRFANGVATLHQQGCTIFLEIGPKPTLLGMAEANYELHGKALTHSSRDSRFGPPLMLPSLREGQSDWRQMLTSLGALYAQGVTIDWQGFDQDYPRQKVPLPTYPFQRQRYWLAASGATQQAESPSKPQPQVNTPLVESLTAGDLDTLTALLADQLSPVERDTLPVILGLLAKEQQRQALLAPQCHTNSSGSYPVNGGVSTRQDLPVASVSIRQILSRTPVVERPAVLMNYFCTLVANILRWPTTDAVDPTENLLALGFDSLMAVELRNHIRQTWRVNLDVARFLAGLSIAELTSELLAQEDMTQSRQHPFNGSVGIAEVADQQRVAHNPKFEDEEAWITL
ncbi:MAG: beta-ketoacyl synthase N-terminal-like domain-containing protein [Caldilineaceae bacterium]